MPVRSNRFVSASDIQYEYQCCILTLLDRDLLDVFPHPTGRQQCKTIKCTFCYKHMLHREMSNKGTLRNVKCVGDIMLRY